MAQLRSQYVVGIAILLMLISVEAYSSLNSQEINQSHRSLLASLEDNNGQGNVKNGQSNGNNGEGNDTSKDNEGDNDNENGKAKGDKDRGDNGGNDKDKDNGEDKGNNGKGNDKDDKGKENGDKEKDGDNSEGKENGDKEEDGDNSEGKENGDKEEDGDNSEGKENGDKEKDGDNSEGKENGDKEKDGDNSEGKENGDKENDGDNSEGKGNDGKGNGNADKGDNKGKGNGDKDDDKGKGNGDKDGDNGEGNGNNGQGNGNNGNGNNGQGNGNTPPPHAPYPPPSPYPPHSSPPPPTPLPPPPPPSPSPPPPSTPLPPPTPPSPSPPPSSPPPSTPIPPPRKAKCMNISYPQCYALEHTCPTACPAGCHVDCVTCKPVCKCDHPGAVCQDPRFIGGDGITFYFHGRKDRDFCIVTDNNLHINAHFIGRRNQLMKRDFTWVQSIGILFGNHRISIGAKKTSTWSEAVDRFFLIFDGHSILLPSIRGAKWESESSPKSSITRTTETNGIVLEIEGLFRITANVVPITQEDSRVHNYGITTEDCFAHLELGFKFFSLTEEVNGVLGQTYRSDYVSRVKMGVSMPVVGGAREFAATGLLEPDCSVSQFDAEKLSYASSMIIQLPDLSCSSDLHAGGVVCKR